ncbi:MAG: MATE family efflux transporter [Candidatus Diapherotrites archaeon]|nr:MATE family efflux transporter [Candidatus Diapherotrites archaeon]
MEKDLTAGSIAKNLAQLAWPLIFGMLFQTAFNIIDTIYVGMLGTKELAAISATFPVVFIFIAIASGLAAGCTALVAQAIGAKRFKEASNIAEHSLLLGFIISASIAALGILLSQYVFLFMGITAELLPYTLSYANIIFFGFIFLFVGFIAMSIIRAQGDTKTPMKFQIAAVLMNVALDPVMIFGLFGFPALGLTGAAIATVISRSFMAFANIAYLMLGKTKIRLSPKNFSFKTEIIKRIIKVGLPASAANSINSIGMILLMSLVALFGTEVIAVFGIGMRLDGLVTLPAIGLATAAVTLVGQNYGSKKYERAEKTVEYAAVFALAVSSALAMLMFFFPEAFLLPFTREQSVIEIGKTYISIVAFSYIFRSITISINSAFQGTGKTTISLAITTLSWALTLALSYLLMQSNGAKGIWLGMFYSSAIIAIFSALIFKSKKWL